MRLIWFCSMTQRSLMEQYLKQNSSAGLNMPRQSTVFIDLSPGRVILFFMYFSLPCIDDVSHEKKINCIITICVSSKFIIGSEAIPDEYDHLLRQFPTFHSDKVHLKNQSDGRLLPSQ